MIDKTSKDSTEIINVVAVKIDKFSFPVSFMVMDIKEEL